MTKNKQFTKNAADGTGVTMKTKKPFFKRATTWIGAIVIIGIFGSMGGEDEAAPTEDAAPDTEEAAAADPKEDAPEVEEAAPEEEAAAAGIGDALTVGDVTFTAHSFETAQNVGGAYGVDAKGTFLLLDVEVLNNGKEALTVDSSFFKLKTADGTTFDADTMASVYANEAGGGFFLEQVNPTLSLKGVIAFDLGEAAATSNDLTLHVQTGLFGTETGEISLKK